MEMADSANSTGTSALKGFAELGADDQAAVVWRSEGKSPSQIAALLQSEFGIERSAETVRSWFKAGQRLEQAFLDYNGQLARSSVKRARLMGQRLAERAVMKAGEIIEGPDDALALRASGMFIDKFIPSPKPGTDVDFDDEPGDINQEVLDAVERDLEIYRLGEEALAAKQLAKEADDATQ